MERVTHGGTAIALLTTPTPKEESNPKEEAPKPKKKFADIDLSGGSIVDSGGTTESVEEKSKEETTKDSKAVEEPKEVAQVKQTKEKPPAASTKKAQHASVAKATLNTLVLPGLPEDVDDEDLAEEFIASATKRLRKIYDEDHEDPSVLQALLAKLQTEKDLEALRPLWSPVMKLGIERALLMQKAHHPLANLRDAFRGAAYSETLKVFENVTMSQCRLAEQRLEGADPKTQSLEFSVPNLGRKPVAMALKICQDAHTAALMLTEFPAIEGRRAARRQAQKDVRRFLDQGNIRKLTLPDGGWKNDPKNRRSRFLKVVVAVERKNVFPEDPCVMLTLEMSQTKRGSRWGKTECCREEKVQPIDCNSL